MSVGEPRRKRDGHERDQGELGVEDDEDGHHRDGNDGGQEGLRDAVGDEVLDGFDVVDGLRD